jgi:hypothetical protein
VSIAALAARVTELHLLTVRLEGRLSTTQDAIAELGAQVNAIAPAVKRQAVREALRPGSSNLTVNGQFQSRLPWAPAGYLPLRIGDPKAGLALRLYAEAERETDPQFADDLLAAVEAAEKDAADE